MDEARDDLAALITDPIPYLQHTDPDFRRLAVAACADRVDEAAVQIAGVLATDPESRVRAEAAELLGDAGDEALDALDRARDDPDPVVVEAVITAYGEIGSAAPVPWLIESAARSSDRLVQEAAVAALGAIGDDRAVPILLDLVASGPPQVRRRSVVALTVFDDERIEPALLDASRDRNPGVREAAEMVVGRSARRER